MRASRRVSWRWRLSPAFPTEVRWRSRTALLALPAELPTDKLSRTAPRGLCRTIARLAGLFALAAGSGRTVGWRNTLATAPNPGGDSFGCDAPPALRRASAVGDGVLASINIATGAYMVLQRVSVCCGWGCL